MSKRKAFPDLFQAIVARNLEDVRTNLENVGEPKEVYERASMLACERGYPEILAVLLQDARIHVNEPCLRKACELGHVAIVKMLLEDRRIDPTYNNFEALERACSLGYIAIVRLFLADTRILRANKNRDALGYVFLSAAYEGHLDIVQLFLEEDALDPDLHNNSALIAACEHGQTEVVQFLLGTGRTDPRDQDNLCIRLACQNGHLGVLQRLLLDPRVNPVVEDNFPVLSAADHGHIDIVRVLLDLPAVVANPNIFDEAHKGSFAEPINRLILSKEQIVPLRTVHADSPVTCFDPILHGDANVSRDYATFSIRSESGALLHVGCLDADALAQYMKNDYLFFACKPHVPVSALYIQHSDVGLEGIRRLAFTFNVYVLDAEARQLRVGNNYILTPTDRIVGRIASKEVLERGLVHIGDVHCGPPYSDKLYRIERVLDSGFTNDQLAEELAKFGVRRMNRVAMIKELEACRSAESCLPSHGGTRRRRTVRRNTKTRRSSHRVQARCSRKGL